MEAKAFLQQVRRLDYEIENKLIERAQWLDLGRRVSPNYSGAGGKSAGGRGGVERAAVQLGDLDRELDKMVDKLIRKKQRISSTLSRLPNAQEYEVLHLRYIQYLSLMEIADRWRVPYTNVTTIHGRALRNLQRILDEEERKNG